MNATVLTVNVGLERPKPRKHGARRAWERMNIQGLPFPGKWDDDRQHEAFRSQVRADNPGWTITGYALAPEGKP